jgi:hypothetical protein
MHNFQTYINNINLIYNHPLCKKNETLFPFVELYVANTFRNVLLYVVYRVKMAKLAGTCRKEY